MTTNRLLYLATAIALTGVLVFDKNFTVNTTRGLGPVSINPWIAAPAVGFAVATCIALLRELRP